MGIRPGLLDSKISFRYLNPDAKAVEDKYKNYTSTVSGEAVWLEKEYWAHVRNTFLDAEPRGGEAGLLPAGTINFTLPRYKWIKENVKIGNRVKWNKDKKWYTIETITDNFRSHTITMFALEIIETET